MQDWITQRVHTCYWISDLSCIVTMLMLLGERFGKPISTEVINAANGLHAGRLQSQCGLVEGALMFIGMYGAQQGLEIEEIHAICFAFASQYEEQFNSTVCSELRPQGFFKGQPPHLCEALTCRSIEFAVQYIKENLACRS